jgi:hypothetical protein
MSDDPRPLLRTLNPEVPKERPWSKRKKVLVFGGIGLIVGTILATAVVWLYWPQRYSDSRGGFSFTYASRFEKMADEELVESDGAAVPHVVFKDTGRPGDSGDSGYFNSFSVSVHRLTAKEVRTPTPQLLVGWGRGLAAGPSANVLHTEGPRTTTLAGMPCVVYAEKLRYQDEYWWFESYLIPGRRHVLRYDVQLRDADGRDERDVLLKPASTLRFTEARS